MIWTYRVLQVLELVEQFVLLDLAAEGLDVGGHGDHVCSQLVDLMAQLPELHLAHYREHQQPRHQRSNHHGQRDQQRLPSPIRLLNHRTPKLSFKITAHQILGYVL